LLHPSFGYQIRRQRVPSIPAQANQVALLDIIASLLSNQILRELKLTTLLKTLFFVVIVVVVVVAIVVITIEGLR
jgi:cytochrome c biogenesis protein ResB